MNRTGLWLLSGLAILGLSGCLGIGSGPYFEPSSESSSFDDVGVTGDIYAMDVVIRDDRDLTLAHLVQAEVRDRKGAHKLALRFLKQSGQNRHEYVLSLKPGFQTPFDLTLVYELNNETLNFHAHYSGWRQGGITPWKNLA